jgi:hypothetical protein
MDNVSKKNVLPVTLNPIDRWSTHSPSILTNEFNFKLPCSNSLNGNTGVDLRKKINWPVKFLNNWPLQNSTGPSGAGTAYPSGENEFTQGFNGVHIARSLVSCFLGGGGKSPLSYRSTYFSGQWDFEGASCSKILLVQRASNFFFLSRPLIYRQKISSEV